MELEAGGSSEPTMNVNNGGRPTCLYNDPSVFVKTEFDTGNHQAEYDTQSISTELTFKREGGVNFQGTYFF